MATDDMHDGLYQALITRDLQAFLDQHQGSDERARVDDADLAERLSRHLVERFRRRLHIVRDPADRVALANALLRTIEDHDDVVVPARELLSLRAAASGPTIEQRYQERPRTPLNDAALLTNAPDEPSLAHELRAETDSADRIDLLCAFVMWRGVRLLDEPLRRAREAGVPLRILTTTYIGGTERQALDRLIRDYGAQVKVQYDAARTRLHAKAWLFHRDTGFHTGYVGSSNLSTSALLEGVEWNVRLAQATTPSLLQKFRATFDSYWDSADFEPYDPDRDRDRLDDALNAAAGRRGTGSVTISISGLQVRPFPYQQEMLEALTAEREAHGRHRNLVVAATGTGKTVVAALDYRGLCEQGRTQPTLFFVAHRREILEQSLRTYREVLTDANFGELYVGNARPERWQHVFASVQSLTAYGVENIPADAFEVVVIDEFHHAEARTYRRLVEHVTPRELLGLTATPERADGVDVRAEFFDGRTATELRLWDALGADLLCPFHYFAIADGTDLRDVRWTRGRYDGDQLGRLYTGNDRRAAIVLKELHDKVADVDSMRALGFCVSVDHADYMARVFNAAGVAARAVSGTTSPAARAEALSDLRSGRVKVLFTVDLFNEGLDVPDVETVLFLRPTESATVFLQQLGRGLRRTPGKAVLTVLDFVGHHRKEFQFANRYRALTGGTRRQVLRQVEGGFPFLPSGCQIVLDRQSRELVLDNIRSQVGRRWSQIVSELRSYGDQDLPTFLEESGLELSDILRQGRSWTGLRRDAGLATAEGSVLEERLLRRVRAFAHVDDPLRARAYSELLADDAPSYDALSPLEQRLARMLFFSLWPDGGGESYGATLAALRAERASRREITAVIDLSFDASRHLTLRLPEEVASIPLQVHARYQLREVLAAIDYASQQRSATSVRHGVAYSESMNIDAFFVTLKKSEADYSPTTMYRDYPISPELFHWESQSTTTVASPTGQRYLSGTSTVLLFVRQEQKDDLGTSPYLFLGPATYVSHQGDKPIAITWRLLTPMPTDFFHRAAPIAQ